LVKIDAVKAMVQIQEDEPDENYEGISFMMWGDVNDIIEESTEY
jgi:hypothetical protein